MIVDKPCISCNDIMSGVHNNKRYCEACMSEPDNPKNRRKKEYGLMYRQRCKERREAENKTKREYTKKEISWYETRFGHKRDDSGRGNAYE